MSELFLSMVNMSISASWIVLAVLLLRLLLKKAPKWITVLLWGIVAVRLVCPFSMESVLSLIPSAQTISPEIMLERTPQIHTGISIFNNTINPVISEATVTIAPEKSVNILHVLTPIFTMVWLVGIAVLLAYTIFSFWRVKRMIGTAVRLRDNIFQSETVASPFVLGIIQPKIYLPFAIQPQDMEHVIAHEQAHIRRKDHLWKPLGFLLLTLHWFNPLMWLGYVLLCRDIELACDEKVVKKLDEEKRADYSQALLTCSVNRPMIAACPLAFGEVGVKTRVKSVLSYKKPAFWIIVVAVIVCVAVAVCFLTNPPSSESSEAPSDDSTQRPIHVSTQIGENTQFSPIIDAAAFDIDGDGKQEQCTLGYGPTSGLFTFTLSVWEIGEANSRYEYFNIFNGIAGDLSFAQMDDGMKLRLVPQTGDPVIYYSFSVRNGNIVLSADGEEVGYWGQQGIGSGYSSVQMDLDGNIISATSFPSYELYLRTPTEEIEEKYDNGEFVITKTYSQMQDGSWSSGGYIYLYRLEITGRLHNAAKNTTYIVLSNRKDITFDETWKASGFSSNSADYFAPEDAVIVGHKLF